MKIAYVVYGYTNPGGTERVLSVKANYLLALGYDVSIISIKKEMNAPFFSFSESIHFYSLGINDFDNPKKESVFVERLTHLFEIIKPDISITMGPALSKYLYKVKDISAKIYELHFTKYKRKTVLANWDKYVLGRMISSIYTWKHDHIASQYDQVVVLTKEDSYFWRNLKNVTVIPNPLSFVSTKKTDLKSKRVIAVGRFTKSKGFNNLIDIWAIVNRKFPDWTLSIWGKGHLKTKLQKQVEMLNLSHVIEINDPSLNIEEEYCKSSIYALSSDSEAFGLVLMEAMSCGLPAVSFDCKTGPANIITEGEDGFLVKLRDKKAFAQKLCILIENEELRVSMGQKAAENMQRFSVDKVMSQWISLFEDL